ncbi:hypothetical protein LEP1GSC074_0355 [Leptospira noguchii str. Hook]|uniref:Uncharacterized protein n=1 Tax=Leptospira noguchii serovar Autumnalis str. ZUN142 TaxID=1085540 RepID=M6U7D7_9LEPT|nr:hypothetical protein LEP1GSC041_3291 [Leptospira noguchii str. 2006001870]EMO40410.1 hypothetical protein LEP1GSC186_4603 [Leptospira noguchii serovar Autumnalis str. ZUN142]EMS83772.1 hypothetical protein LEP1GSC074_0355 [Leptospira noguchii str. Hook]
MKQKLSGELIFQRLVIKDLNLRKRHTFKEVTKEGIALSSFFFSFPRGI